MGALRLLHETADLDPARPGVCSRGSSIQVATGERRTVLGEVSFPYNHWRHHWVATHLQPAWQEAEPFVFEHPVEMMMQTVLKVEDEMKPGAGGASHRGELRWGVCCFVGEEWHPPGC